MPDGDGLDWPMDPVTGPGSTPAASGSLAPAAAGVGVDGPDSPSVETASLRTGNGFLNVTDTEVTIVAWPSESCCSSLVKGVTDTLTASRWSDASVPLIAVSVFIIILKIVYD